MSFEVPLFTRRIDIVAKKRSEIVAIELKLHDWRDAVDQARLNLRVSDYSFVALRPPAGGFSGATLFDLIHHGIGLISVDGTAIEILKPKHSDAIQPGLRKKFLSDLRESKTN